MYGVLIIHPTTDKLLVVGAGATVEAACVQARETEERMGLPSDFEGIVVTLDPAQVAAFYYGVIDAARLGIAIANPDGTWQITEACMPDEAETIFNPDVS